jgi:hypothetical protein
MNEKIVNEERSDAEAADLVADDKNSIVDLGLVTDLTKDGKNGAINDGAAGMHHYRN